MSVVLCPSAAALWNTSATAAKATSRRNPEPSGLNATHLPGARAGDVYCLSCFSFTLEAAFTNCLRHTYDSRIRLRPPGARYVSGKSSKITVLRLGVRALRFQQVSSERTRSQRRDRTRRKRIRRQEAGERTGGRNRGESGELLVESVRLNDDATSGRVR
jgi:hypothetical protein